MQYVFIIIAVLALGLLIVFHEFGHYWAARRAGMRVERFSVGFGPVIASWRSGDTEFALSAVPFGGYVKISGIAAEDEVEADDVASYANKPAWQRLLFIGAGPAANYLLALMIGVFMLMTMRSVPNDESWTRVGRITPGLPASAAGVHEGDDIAAVDGVPVRTWAGLKEAIGGAAFRHPNQPLRMDVTRNDTLLSLKVTPSNSGGSYIIGVTPADRPVDPLSFPAAFVGSLRNIWAETADEARMIGTLVSRLFVHKAGAPQVRLSGPIGIVAATADAASHGARESLVIVWKITIALGFINLMPVPGLDGGRLMTLGYEVVARRRINQRVEGWIHGVGLILVFVLLVFVSRGDIMDLVARHG